RYYRR
ncbi:ABC transporter ATP-binding protein uup, partial [Haemophilus influenzae]